MTSPRERPILFSGPMVRAILDGRKTQTRRVVKDQPNAGPNGKLVHLGERSWGLLDGILSGEWKCPYGQPGDRLWVRETWGWDWYDDGNYAHKRPVYRADGEGTPRDQGEPQPWNPSIHMPRSVSRLTLEITEVRVERLQEITEADAEAEGFEGNDCTRTGIGYASNREAFCYLWNDLNADRGYGWDANPWVWVIGFRKECP